MAEQINEILEKIGSNFRTDDGLTIIAHIGNLTFLRRMFESERDCLAFVREAAERREYHGN